MPRMMLPDMLARPSFRLGWSIVLSRSVSLVLALILAVVLSVVSFMVLIPAIITAYYYAVSQSRAEAFFIDLANVFRTNSLVFAGIKTYFLRSYLFFVLGLLPPSALLLWPMLPYVLYGEEQFYTTAIAYGGIYWILMIPAFFWLGAVVMYGYPWLVATNSVFSALQATIKGIRLSPILTFVIGFVLLVPFIAIPFHILMVLTYPMLVAWAITTILQDQ